MSRKKKPNNELDEMREDLDQLGQALGIPAADPTRPTPAVLRKSPDTAKRTLKVILSCGLALLNGAF
jgi:hypothetical protein